MASNRPERIKAFVKTKNCTLYYSVQFFKEPRQYGNGMDECEELWSCEIHEGDCYVYVVDKTWEGLLDKIESKLEEFGYTRE